MNKKYYTKDHRPDKKEFYEKNSGECLIETAGYQPLHLRVGRMLEAGRRLPGGDLYSDPYIESVYGFDYDGDINENDTPSPVRSSKFDIADASQIRLRINEKIAEGEELLSSQTSPDQPDEDVQKTIEDYVEKEPGAEMEGS